MSLLPAAICLIGAHDAMRRGGHDIATESDANIDLTTRIVRDFPTGLNAGWLAFASGIGIYLVVAEILGPRQMSRRLRDVLGASLVTAVSVYGFASRSNSSRTMFYDAGYALASAWACYGIIRRDEKQFTGPMIRWVAKIGCSLGVGGLVASIIDGFRRYR